MFRLFVFLFALQLTGQAPVIDGRIDEAEWVAATRESLVGGGDVLLLQRAGNVYVAIRGPRAGLASLCTSKGDVVRILHASAATGEARFAHSAGAWRQTAGFEWHLRDSPRQAEPAAAQHDAMARDFGWTANPSASGAAHREFQIRAADVDALAVTFLATADPLALSYWPSSVADDCRTNLKIAQGFLPESASFDPSHWHQLR